MFISIPKRYNMCASVPVYQVRWMKATSRESPLTEYCTELLTRKISKLQQKVNEFAIFRWLIYICQNDCYWRININLSLAGRIKPLVYVQAKYLNIAFLTLSSMENVEPYSETFKHCGIFKKNTTQVKWNLVLAGLTTGTCLTFL